MSDAALTTLVAPRTHLIDCCFADQPEVAGAFLLVEDDEVAFVETNTSYAVPRLLEALASVGRAPEDVTQIWITHIHLDHAGGAGQLMQACPNAVLHAHPKAAPHAIDPTRIVAGATEVYGEEDFAAWYGEVLPIPAERVVAHEEGSVVTLGARSLRVLHTRGHANHHLCLVDDVADAVYTGDSFGLLYPHLQRHGVCALPTTTPTDFDPEAAHATIDRILAEGRAAVLPTHFGAHHALQAIADQLHPRLDAHAAIVDQADRDDLHDEALDRFCVEGVERVFRAALDEAGLGADSLAWKIASFDCGLNAQGLAFAVKKRRYKRAKARA